MKNRRIELHIGELAVDGLGAVDGDVIAQSTRSELRRLLADRGLAKLPRNAAGLNAGTFQVASGSTSGDIGTQIARAVYGAIGKVTR
jgi:hypothetical protein